ncbi:MAG: GNAT family protein, partial [Pseudomonadota bacterium]
LSAYRAWVEAVAGRSDPMFFTVIERASQRAMGVASYLRIDPENGSIEVGHIHFSPLLQRNPAGTEALYLMMRQAFELGYRRFEWKCNALNERSRHAAQRLGLSYEGVFRHATIAKGRNRDTAWYAAVDSEWPRLQAAYDTWLAAENFDDDGRQRVALSALTDPILVARG